MVSSRTPYNNTSRPILGSFGHGRSREGELVLAKEILEQFHGMLESCALERSCVVTETWTMKLSPSRLWCQCNGTWDWWNYVFSCGQSPWYWGAFTRTSWLVGGFKFTTFIFNHTWGWGVVDSICPGSGLHQLRWTSFVTLKVHCCEDHEVWNCQSLFAKDIAMECHRLSWVKWQWPDRTGHGSTSLDPWRNGFLLETFLLVSMS